MNSEPHPESVARGRLIAVLALALLAGGCRSTLLADLDEAESNEVIASLSHSGISASKVASGKGRFSVEVDQAQLADAWQALRANGLPRPRHQGFRQVFAERGLVPGKLEQQALYLSALQEELAETLEAVAGVRTARVHVTWQPAEGRLGTPAHASSASVLLEVLPGLDQQVLEPEQVRRLVAHAVAGLSPEQVAVVVVPTPSEPPAAKAALPPAPSRAWPLKVALAGIGGGGLLVLAGLLFSRRRRGRQRFPKL